MKLGWEQPRRIARIKELNAEAVAATFPVSFQAGASDLPIRVVSIEMPKYRLNNGRTEAAQLQYLALHRDLSKDFFSADLESDAAQSAQHEILSGMIEEKKLLPYFRDHAQEEPLILTATGFVLNGNRRLCAFRTLFSESAREFSNFENIRVVILPSGDEKDHDRLESRLQRNQDIRADYPWYADAVKYRRRLNEFSDQELRAVEGVPEGHIPKYIAMLDVAERFLEYRGTPFRYALLSEGAGGGDGFYAFEQLVKGRAKFKDAERREEFSYACFAEMLDPKGRVYDTIPKIAEHFDHVEAELPKTEEVPAPEEPVDQNAESIDALFWKEEVNDVASRLDYAKNVANAEKVRDVLQTVVGERELIKRDTKKQNFVYEQVRKGVTFLKEAFNGINEHAKLDGIDQQLTEAEEYLRRLREWTSQKR